MKSPSSPPKRSPGVFVWLGIAGVLIYGLGIVAFVAFSAYRGFRRGMDDAAAERLAATPPASAPADDDDGPPGTAPAPRPALPSVKRHVPSYPLSVLDGCTDGDLHAIAGGIGAAIDVGAPLYNEGNFAGCYHMYEGAAVDLERKLGPACPGPRTALDAGRARAAAKATPSAQAWAMRDVFDGLLDVIARRKGI
jgi:hypothetical protein